MKQVNDIAHASPPHHGWQHTYVVRLISVVFLAISVTISLVVALTTATTQPIIGITSGILGLFFFFLGSVYHYDVIGGFWSKIVPSIMLSLFGLFAAIWFATIIFHHMG